MNLPGGTGSSGMLSRANCLMFNAGTDAVDFGLPPASPGAGLHVAVDPSRQAPGDLSAADEEPLCEDPKAYRLSRPIQRSSDMRDLLAQEAHDIRAAEAVALFCYQAKKWIGSFAAALGGLDTLVFAGGIGENAPLVRARICEGLAFLGIALSESRNAQTARVISTDASRATVRVIRTDEDLMIARSVCSILETGAGNRKDR